VKKLKQLAGMDRQEMNARLPETAQHICSTLQNAGQGSAEDRERVLHTAGNVVKKYPSLRPEIAQPACRKWVVSMLKAVSKNERIHRNSFSLSQLWQKKKAKSGTTPCVAQYTLQVSCEQFWQRMPETCVERLNHRAACSVVYAYGKMLQVKAVPPASDILRTLQHKIVAHHARKWEAQAVGNALWSLSRQGLLVGDAAVHLQEAAARTAATMDSRSVANTLWAFTNINSDLGEAAEPMTCAIVRVSEGKVAQNFASTPWVFEKMKSRLGETQEPLMRAVSRVSDTMNAQEVANTLLAFAKVGLELREAQEPLMRAVLRVSDRMNAQGVANTLWGFATMGVELGEAQEPLMRAVLRVSDSMK
jgi:hypothetical protein